MRDSSLKSQFVTSSWGGARRALPDAFPSDFIFVMTAEDMAEVVANCDHLGKLTHAALPIFNDTLMPARASISTRLSMLNK